MDQVSSELRSLGSDGRQTIGGRALKIAAKIAERKLVDADRVAEKIVRRIKEQPDMFGESCIGWVARLRSRTIVAASWVKPWVLHYCYASVSGKIISVRINTLSGALKTTAKNT